MTDPRTALVLFSGGQDSTVCLAWALARHARVETVGFDYGQRHRIELDCREGIRQSLASLDPTWRERLGDDHLLDLSLLGKISDTALTSERAIELQANGLPNTFVPGRNLLFLGFAATVAYRRSASVLVGGMCETDYSGYPDCRDNTLKAMQLALSLGLATPMTVETPLMFLTKAQTWSLGEALGGQALVDLIVEQTHTCYLGERGARHPWGYGCGHCPACALRAAGHADYLAGRTNRRVNTHWLLQVAVVAVIVFWMVGAYNRLMRLRNAVAAAWGHVEPALARRGEAMNAIVEQVRAPLADEAVTLQSLAEADTRTRQAAEAVRASRARADTVLQWVAMEAALASPATRLKALLELHAAQLREEPACAGLPARIQAWNDTDSRVDFTRQTFNQAVQVYNDALRQWPTRAITVIFGFAPAGRA